MTDSVPNPKTCTYVMKHRIADKYYVGKTVNVERRMKEHKTDLRSKDSVHERVTMLRIVNRVWHTISNYSLIWCVKGDQEQKIKSFGVKRFMFCVLNGGTLS